MFSTWDKTREGTGKLRSSHRREQSCSQSLKYSWAAWLGSSSIARILSLTQTRKIDCRKEEGQEILEGLACHLEALNLAIKPTLTAADKEKYLELFNKWIKSYLDKEPLKRVRRSLFLLQKRSNISSETET